MRFFEWVVMRHFDSCPRILLSHATIMPPCVQRTYQYLTSVIAMLHVLLHDARQKKFCFLYDTKNKIQPITFCFVLFLFIDWFDSFIPFVKFVSTIPTFVRSLRISGCVLVQVLAMRIVEILRNVHSKF
jgi:hypothetical protein